MNLRARRAVLAARAAPAVGDPPPKSPQAAQEPPAATQTPLSVALDLADRLDALVAALPPATLTDRRTASRFTVAAATLREEPPATFA